MPSGKKRRARLGELARQATAEGLSTVLVFEGPDAAVHDEVTIDLSYKILMQTKKDLGDAFVPTQADEVVRHFQEDLGRKGKRFGAGFYEYPEGGRKYLWPGLAEEYPPADQQPDLEYIQKRLLYIQSVETARCMEEHVVPEAADADVGSILGWGFPPWTGGTLSLIDTVGLETFVEECAVLAERHGPRFAPPDWLRQRSSAR